MTTQAIQARFAEQLRIARERGDRLAVATLETALSRMVRGRERFTWTYCESENRLMDGNR